MTKKPNATDVLPAVAAVSECIPLLVAVRRVRSGIGRLRAKWPRAQTSGSTTTSTARIWVQATDGWSGLVAYE